MSLFRVEKDTNFSGPHQGTPTAEGGVSLNEADAAMIMIHGRGATAQSIVGLSSEFEIQQKLAYRAPQANSNTWYPYSFMEPIEKNEPGLSSGLQRIHDLIVELEEAEIPKNKIYLLGFSQGACLASEYVARHPAKYAGLIALSGGLIGDSVNPDQYEGDLKGTPVFMGCSDVDPHIPKERVNTSEEVLSGLGAQVTKKLYPGMGHLVNQDEIDHINSMINS
ncbi:alpha/beta hydrolase [Gracilimonas mengyeensis]|uniref:Phospholipase/carboxylesterase n=1 Tax=Gracilimonas mengyeensis TaxID=1302730 RepID=A0A521DLF4_9BACT|nr:dienelactone hydrolase family protein [Gracilimonas mengyeensis]SMO72412.1 phospholipase/carboxylesterase [Gracilimonas mengyeensis]